MSNSLDEKVHFAEMLNTRFCHDMAGPVSAISNGLEFLKDDSSPEMQQQAMDLLVLSSKEALSKLQVYRMAYGRVNLTTESSVDEIRDIVGRFFLHDKAALDWPQSPEDGFEPKLNNGMRQVLVNMIMLVSRFLVYGGTLSVRKKIESDRRCLIVTGENERLKEDAEIDGILRGEGGKELSPHNVPAYFFMNVVQLRNMTLRFERESGKVTLTATYD